MDEKIKPSLFRTRDLYVIATLLSLAGAQLIILSLTPLNLSGDEAYYWNWSKHLDAAYYEKGPGIALLIVLGRMIFGDNEIGVRFSALLCQFLLAVLLYFFASRRYSFSSARTLLLLFYSSLLFGTLGLFMTGDPPLCLCWALAIVSAERAVRNDKPGWWVAALLLVGIGALFKYSSLILLPSFALFLLLSPQRRRHLLSPWLVLGSLLSFACLLPVLWWNSRHNWINIAQNLGHLESNHSKIGIAHVLELFFGQWGMIGLLVFPLIALALARGLRCWRAGDLTAGLYFFSSVPLAALCFTLSFSRPVYANWPMPLFIGALLLLIHLEDSGQLLLRPVYLRRTLGLNAILLVASFLLFSGSSLGLPARILPSKMLVGWRQLGQAVEHSLINSRYAANNSGTECHCASRASFVISEKYMTASEVRFYADSHPPAFVADPDEPKLNEYDVWNEWNQQKGHDALMVFSDPDEWKDYAHNFCKISPAETPIVNIRYGGHSLKKFSLYRACSFSGTDLTSFAIDAAAGPQG